MQGEESSHAQYAEVVDLDQNDKQLVVSVGGHDRVD